MTPPARTALLLCLLLASACPGGGAGEVGDTGGDESATTPATAPTGDTGSPPTTTEALTNDTGVLTDTTGPIDPTASTDPTATTPSTDPTASTDPTDPTGDPGPLVYPDKRVGIFYLAWHAYAWDAVAQANPAGPRTIEAVIRGGDVQFADIFLDQGLFDVAKAFHWQQEPALGFYSLSRPRDGEAPYGEPDFAAAYPDTAKIAADHADKLWRSGDDSVFVDVTNLAAVTPFSDVLGRRPFQVLLEEWGALRAQGKPTPQVAAWVPALDVGDQTPMFRALLDDYAAVYPDLVFAPDGQPVMFIVDTTGNSIFPPHADEIKARGVLPVPLWGNLPQALLDTGLAAWMQPCTTAGYDNNLIDAATTCAQRYTTASPLGTVVSVSRSFQTLYASLPLQAAGRIDDLTFRKQFATALTVQLGVLLINPWNGPTAQPQMNPSPADRASLRRSMGVGDAPDADPSADWLWVDGYGAEFSRDFEPTVEDGGAGYALLASCLRVWRTGATACDDIAEACCQLPQSRVFVHSLRRKGNPTAGEHVPTADYNEVVDILKFDVWEEVCNPLHVGTPALCGNGNTGDGPFRLYAGDGPGRTPLHRCYTGVNNFISPDPGCEGTQFVSLLGYAAASPTSDSPRPLTRCRNADNIHLHWIDGPCPPGSVGEGILGYVR